MSYRTLSHERGFTLIELMTVVSMLTILILVAVPGLQSLIANQRARSTAYDLMADLSLARSEAVKRNKDVILNPVSNWAGGWTVKTSATAELLSQRNEVGQGVAITRSPASVTYDGSGRLSGTTSTIRFELFDGNTTYRCITLDPSGQPSTKIARCP